MRATILKIGIAAYSISASIVLLIRLISSPLTAGNPEILYYAAGIKGNFEIMRMDVSRGVAVNLTHNPGDDTFAAWSPDGQRIAFYAHRNARTDLYLMNADGTDAHRLIDSGGTQTYPAWSPDGQWIAYVSLQVPLGGIYRIHPDGSGNQRLTESDESVLAWSPDSQHIAFTYACNHSCDIFLMNADGSDNHALTMNSAFSVDPIWSPDGQHLVFMSNRHANFELYRIEADCDPKADHFYGCNATQLTNNNAFDGYPVWSPDGKWLAFLSDRDGNFEIYRLPADCDPCPPATRLTMTAANELGLIWSPDSSQIAFISNDDLDVMNADGSGLRPLAHHILRDQLPAWRP